MVQFVPLYKSQFQDGILRRSYTLSHFRRVRKIAKIDYSLRHVCPVVPTSARMEQLGSHWMNFHEN
jgi:hypothetical protein